VPDPIRCVDPHIHSHFSDAPKNSLRAITQACLAQGIGACITDHNEIRGAVRLYEEGQVATVPAIEIGSRTRVEFLVYFDEPATLEAYFKRSVEPYKRRNFYARLAREFEPLVREAKEMGGMVTLPHPFAPGWKNLGARVNAENLRRLTAPDFLRRIDFVEVINGHVSDKRNFRAWQFAEQHRKARVVGSDAHAPEDIGKVHVEFSEPVAADEILATLARRNRLLMKEPFSPLGFMNTARRVAPRHVLLYFLPAKQRVWMNARARAHGRT
jgi:predicted metal-dependent phosphoesterase TrpH